MMTTAHSTVVGSGTDTENLVVPRNLNESLSETGSGKVSAPVTSEPDIVLKYRQLRKRIFEIDKDTELGTHGSDTPGLQHERNTIHKLLNEMEAHYPDLYKVLDQRSSTSMPSAFPGNSAPYTPPEILQAQANPVNSQLGHLSNVNSLHDDPGSSPTSPKRTAEEAFNGHNVAGATEAAPELEENQETARKRTRRSRGAVDTASALPPRRSGRTIKPVTALRPLTEDSVPPRQTRKLAAESQHNHNSGAPSSSSATSSSTNMSDGVSPTHNSPSAGSSSTPPKPPGINPYTMYFPSPTTPSTATPATPTFPPYPGNSYYYVGPAMAPIPSPGGFAPAPPVPQWLPPTNAPSDVQRQAKPKRLKAHTVTSKQYNIPVVPRDKNGKPMLPLNVGIMTVISLGEVCTREHFHTERYIFPVGYEVTRRYLSTVNPNIEVVYHCTILDGGDGPKFQIIPSDMPDRPIIAGTATGAWSSIVKQANAIRQRQHSNSVSGPDFFGLGQNTIKHLIQELPSANKLRDYVWQTFVEGGPLGGRHAAVIPALPEEYDSSRSLGPYYDRFKQNQPIPSTSSSHYPKADYSQNVKPSTGTGSPSQDVSLQSPPQLHQRPVPSDPPLDPALTDPNINGVGVLPGNGIIHSDERSISGKRTTLDGLGPADHRPSSINPYISRVEGGGPPAAPTLPATFASILNAYPATSGPPRA